MSITSGARYHLVTTCLVNSLLSVIFLLIFAVLLDFKAGFLKIFFTEVTYSVAWRYNRFLCESEFLTGGSIDSFSSSSFTVPGWFSSMKLTTFNMPFFFFLTGSPYFFSEEFYLKIVLMPTLGGS